MTAPEGEPGLQAAAAAEAKAFELAVGAISRKERTVAELRDWLAARGVEPDAREAVVDRLIAIGELDDEDYARRYSEDKRELRGWGPDRIRDALIDRGVARAVAEATAGESHDESIERGAALLLARGVALGDEPGRGRALGYLARRGYPSEVAYEAVRRAERRASAAERRAA